MIGGGEIDSGAPPIPRPHRIGKPTVHGNSRLLGFRRLRRGQGRTMTERYLARRGAMVTGGPSGQGRAIALALAARGADVAIGSYLASHGPLPKDEDSYFPPQAELDAVGREIEAHGVKAVGRD